MTDHLHMATLARDLWARTRHVVLATQSLAQPCVSGESLPVIVARNSG